MVGNLTMYVYTSNGKALNLRQQPSTDSPILAKIPFGAAVEVYQPFNSTWYSIGYNGFTGYVMSHYLVASPPGPKPTAKPSPTAAPDNTLSNSMYDGFTAVYYQAEVRPNASSGHVNLRWGPSLYADIHGRYYMNDVLTIMSQNNTWCQVLDETNHVMGFIMRKFLAQYQGNGIYGSDAAN
jgi:uncharacterized protein YgiM (DUF1202 family)